MSANPDCAYSRPILMTRARPCSSAAACSCNLCAFRQKQNAEPQHDPQRLAARDLVWPAGCVVPMKVKMIKCLAVVCEAGSHHLDAEHTSLAHVTCTVALAAALQPRQTLYCPRKCSYFAVAEHSLGEGPPAKNCSFLCDALQDVLKLCRFCAPPIL
eukprot:1149076-Pelagomonas_calceolata.AAC.9